MPVSCPQAIMSFLGWSTGWIAGMALIDIGIAVWILIVSAHVWINLRLAMMRLTMNGFGSGKPYVWAGAFLIPLLGVVTICNAWNLWKYRNKKGYGYQLVKALAFIPVQGLLLILPYYLSEDCRNTLDFLLISTDFMVFHMMAIDTFTICLYVYEAFSCIVVTVYKPIFKEHIVAAEVPPPRRFSVVDVVAPRRPVSDMIVVSARPAPPKVESMHIGISRPRIIDTHADPEMVENPIPRPMLPDLQQITETHITRAQQPELPEVQSETQPKLQLQPLEDSLAAKVRLEYVNECNRAYQEPNPRPRRMQRAVKRTHSSKPIIPNTNVVASVTATTSKASTDTPPPSTSTESELNTHTEMVLDLKMHDIDGSAPKIHFLKNHLLKRGLLYEDPEFAPDEGSLNMSGFVDIVWKRPYEITPEAKFWTKGMDRFYIRQGAVENCWFVAALASVTTRPDIMEKMIPADNNWMEVGGYCGLFHFRFFVASHWEEVTIDDKLPTQNNELVFMHSEDKTEFWSPLLEKAYAKLKGSYGNLDGGFIRTGYMNLSGGMVEEIHLDQTMRTENLYYIMKAAIGRNNLIGCATVRGSNRRRKCGVQRDRAYAITGIKRVNLGSGGKEPILRIRNPWADDYIFKGDYTDSHKLWKQVDKKTRTELQMIYSRDAEFWFPIRELTDHFDILLICSFRSQI